MTQEHLSPPTAVPVRMPWRPLLVLIALVALAGLALIALNGATNDTFSPAAAAVGGIPGWVLFLLVPVAGLAAFAWIIARRAVPLRRAAPDPRLDRIPKRIGLVLQLWLAQWRQPRYMLAGVLHIVVFFGFLILAIRSTELVILGFVDGFTFFRGSLAAAYNAVKDVAATAVLVAVVILAVRRAFFMPARYAVPEKYGKGHTPEALLVLGLIATLMISESAFEGSILAAEGAAAHAATPLTLPWLFHLAFAGMPTAALASVNLAAYAVHDLTFFFFLCFLPFGKHFHVITSLFNVFFMRVQTGNVKPVVHGITDAQLDELTSFGVKKFEDFTWKHMLDFYSCVDCGRCSDRCPANRVGRPLSPRFISIKARDYAFAHYPILGKAMGDGAPLIGDGGIYTEDEIWSCTTCGACEEECPVAIEYIDKMVDLRRGMVDEGMVPQSVQKPMSALEKRGNPWGKLEKNRAAWTAGVGDGAAVKLVEKGETAETLYFVDSISSYDDRMQKIAQATARVLAKGGVDFAVIGKDEKDSGHDVRRFGEEMLFQTLKEQNVEAIKASEARRIVVNDPHALNALRNDYGDMPPVEHISETIAAGIESGTLKLKPLADSSKTYTYHDPCYLGRHNGTYDAPRHAIDGIPGIRRVEMTGNCRDRSFCCGGGGLMLFYEPEEEQRMGVVRVQQAREAGADVIVTACPYCLTNIEDAIKVAGLEGKMEALDLVELVDGQIE